MKKKIGAKNTPVAFIDSYLQTNDGARWALEENWRQVQEAIHHLDSTAEHAFLLIDILLRPLSHEMCAFIRYSALKALKEDMQEIAVPALICAVEIDPRHIRKSARDELMSLLKEVTGEAFVLDKLEKYKEWSRRKGLALIDDAYLQRHSIDKSAVYGGWLERRNYRERELDGKLVESGAKPDVSAVAGLISEGADVNALRFGRTALMWAASEGHAAVARLLIERGADVNLRSPEGDTALTMAMNHWDCHEVVKMVKMLVDSGASTGGRNNMGWTALMKAASRDDSAEAVKLFVDMGTEVNTKNRDGSTALMIAVCNGRIETARQKAQMLIENGADINAKDRRGNTALMMAAELGHREIVRLLVERGARISDLTAAQRSGFLPDLGLDKVSPPEVKLTPTVREITGPGSKGPGALAPPPQPGERVATRGPYGASSQMGPAIRCSVCSAWIPQTDSVCPSCGSDNKGKRPVAERALPPAEVDAIRTVPEVNGVGSKQRGASSAPLLEDQAHLATKDPYVASGSMGRPIRCKTCLACYPETDSVCPSCGSDGQGKSPAAGRALPSNSAVACVAGGTSIGLPDGKQVQVESVGAGQSVLGYHDGHCRVVSARVMRVARHDPAPVVRLSTDKGELIITPKHRLLTEHGWTSVRDLIVGERVAACFPGAHGLGHARVESITPVEEPRPLYNLYVEDACTYVANGFIAHSYVVLPNLRTVVNRLRVALTGGARTPTARPVLGSDFAGQIHPSTTGS